MTTTRNLLVASLSIAGALGAATASASSFTTVGVYDENTTSANAVDTNTVQATAFGGTVLTAFGSDQGGVIDFEASISGATNTATYGATGAKRLNFRDISTVGGVKTVTSGTVFTTSGSFAPISGANGFGQISDRADFIYDFGDIERVSDGAVLNDLLSQIGFTVLSRRDGSGGYPLDVRATATFSDGSTQVVTDAIGSPQGTDDTFLSFTAAAGESLVSLRLETLVSGTVTAVSSRVGIDDLGFVTTVVPEPASLALLAGGGLLGLGRRRSQR